MAIAVIEPSFGALLVAPVGAAPLTAPAVGAARKAAVAMPPVTMRANEEHFPAVCAETNPLSQNRFAMCRHALSPAALDTGNSFVAP